jgi:hypothetical protein
MGLCSIMADSDVDMESWKGASYCCCRKPLELNSGNGTLR